MLNMYHRQFISNVCCLCLMDNNNKRIIETNGEQWYLGSNFVHATLEKC